MKFPPLVLGQLKLSFTLCFVMLGVLKIVCWNVYVCSTIQVTFICLIENVKIHQWQVMLVFRYYFIAFFVLVSAFKLSDINVGINYHPSKRFNRLCRKCAS